MSTRSTMFRYISVLFLFLIVGFDVAYCNHHQVTLDEVLIAAETLDEAEFKEALGRLAAPGTTVEEITFENATEIINETRKLVSCRGINSTIDRANLTVELINASRLAEILTPDSEVASRESEAQCALIMFYSKRCPFSAKAAPHFNAIIRQFPNITMAAIDSVKHSRVNTQYGIVGVPTFVLFHNARAVAKYDTGDFSLSTLAVFLQAFTGITAIDGPEITFSPEDMLGPVPSSVDEEIDYILLLAWIYIILCILYIISYTRIWRVVVEAIKNGWREAEAQHEHAE